MMKTLELFIRLYANTWVCARCGTTNLNCKAYCTNCNNMKPF